MRTQDCRDLTGQHTAVPMGQRQVDIPQLNAGRIATDLPRRLDHGENAIHAGMHTGQTPAIGIHRQDPARRDAPALDKGTALALGTKAEIFQK